jgi:putative ABC transport system permease protein
LIGAAVGLVVSFLGIWGLARAFPTFPLHMPLWALGLATAVALITGLVFGSLPARRASKLDPVQALSRR